MLHTMESWTAPQALRRKLWSYRNSLPTRRPPSGASKESGSHVSASASDPVIYYGRGLRV